ncbi:hypothetical protein SAMN05216330_112150 [Bradyrhizobium sp. Ghvi]|uniref:hypothetical protein n=1 Tax=Bradyrhizobium sp. Ghvi TaxID=1855319 RepID=UPI0008F41456|nr:hypothetical protein [Bradyrhizobium sp. Ghvi]SFP95025.1 hypothetical protein SAMN05216330_112150 [Bradyrhizobium sp. Ghvi]
MNFHQIVHQLLTAYRRSGGQGGRVLGEIEEIARQVEVNPDEFRCVAYDATTGSPAFYFNGKVLYDRTRCRFYREDKAVYDYAGRVAYYVDPATGYFHPAVGTTHRPLYLDVAAQWEFETLCATEEGQALQRLKQAIFPECEDVDLSDSGLQRLLERRSASSLRR